MHAVIDTDPGHDDALALLLALGSNRIDVESVTTVAGNARVEATTRNAGRVLRMAGRSGVPLHQGSDRPMERELTTATVHGEDGLDGMDSRIDPLPAGADAIDQLADAADRGATIITLGPLTNIARALGTYPDQMRNADRIVSMGGALESPGNQNRVAEFNMYVDPEAAATVIGSELDTTLVPLGPCNDIILKPATIPEDCSIRNELVSLLDPFIRRLREHLDVEGALVYDAIAAFAAAYPEHIETDEHDIVVETGGEHTRGMLVQEERDYVTAEPTTSVVTRIDEAAFKQEFRQSLEGL
ncbi:MAG: nucleoside hydrolase [Candidatus Nanohaloarchaea archaeon]|nr:nucleoside hydrolase [Candidatus Nanohaloarchaea archaeon]